MDDVSVTPLISSSRLVYSNALHPLCLLHFFFLVILSVIVVVFLLRICRVICHRHSRGVSLTLQSITFIV